MSKVCNGKSKNYRDYLPTGWKCSCCRQKKRYYPIPDSDFIDGGLVRFWCARCSKEVHLELTGRW